MQSHKWNFIYNFTKLITKLYYRSIGVDYGQPWRRGNNCNIVTYTDWQRDNFMKALRELVGNNRNVGIEYDHCNLQQIDKIKTALPDASLTDISVPTMQLRMVKSPEEIAVIRQGEIKRGICR